jgi:hypothetical protein
LPSPRARPMARGGGGRREEVGGWVGVGKN